MFTTAQYMRNLVSLTVEDETDGVKTIIRIPNSYGSVLENKEYMQWNLQTGQTNQENESDASMHVIPICSKQWGKQDWQWQTCVSAGGILNVLVNKCESVKTPPEENKVYELSLVFS